MSLFSVTALIRHAATTLGGPGEAVTNQDRRDGCSRQTVCDHAVRVQAAMAATDRPAGT